MGGEKDGYERGWVGEGTGVRGGPSFVDVWVCSYVHRNVCMYGGADMYLRILIQPYDPSFFNQYLPSSVRVETKKGRAKKHTLDDFFVKKGSTTDYSN
jgi:hypothetical protein